MVGPVRVRPPGAGLRRVSREHGDIRGREPRRGVAAPGRRRKLSERLLRHVRMGFGPRQRRAAVAGGIGSRVGPAGLCCEHRCRAGLLRWTLHPDDGHRRGRADVPEVHGFRGHRQGRHGGIRGHVRLGRGHMGRRDPCDPLRHLGRRRHRVRMDRDRGDGPDLRAPAAGPRLIPHPAQVVGHDHDERRLDPGRPPAGVRTGHGGRGGVDRADSAVRHMPGSRHGLRHSPDDAHQGGQGPRHVQ